MMDWLVLDGTYLCYRAFYAMGNLANDDGERTGVVFGFLNDLARLREKFESDRFVCCFDRGVSFRRAAYPPYKMNRVESKKNDEEAHQDRLRQMRLLYREILPELGIVNRFAVKGYEADDLIASAVNSLKGHRVIIVGSDHDLYQLLSPTVSIYNPTKQEIYGECDFHAEFGIGPSQWADVKALAGCSGDNVEGIRGVGEKSAAKFIAGTLSPRSKQFERIVDGTKIWERNLGLVKLPWTGTPKLTLTENEVTPVKWNRLVKRLRFKSLRGVWC
jgi:DNA polymerase-1